MRLPPPFLKRAEALRAVCLTAGVDGFILPRGDEFLGEYVAPYAERLAWLTGFTGSAGLAIVLPEKACVFSDGRYTVQMERQTLQTIWDNQHIAHYPPSRWLADHAQGLRIGYDPKLVSQAMLNAWQASDVTLIALDRNPIDTLWSDQPARPQTPVFNHTDAHAGASSATKRAEIARCLQKEGQNAFILADCTSLAWLLNIRSTDVPLTPVAHAYALLNDDARVTLFVEPDRISEETAACLGPDITLYSPENIQQQLAKLAGKTVRLDPATTPVWFDMVLYSCGVTVRYAPDPCTLPKAIKNAIEQDGARRAHALDAIAVTRFLYSLTTSGAGVHETTLVERLDRFRTQHADYRGQSFEAISASGANAAFPHYKAESGHDAVLSPNSVYLIDSGGQYPFGTTDITRTVWIGPDAPPSDIKEAFTRVLKGHIALSRTRFPENTTGHQLDALARQALWEAGMDYDHGTGHGVGNYLSVHEGPQSISSVYRPVPLKPGMIVSNEPGYYAPGAYGIRIENLLLVTPSQDLLQARKPFLSFEVLTHVPIDRHLIETAFLDESERLWINRYHQDVLERVGPHIENDIRTWLTDACRPLG